LILAKGAKGFGGSERLGALVGADGAFLTDFLSYFSSAYLAYYSLCSSCFLLLASYCLRIALAFHTFLVC
jgi:hypothetical protein